jgi:GH15 family glucan-1,4-alpha-glucosidase
VSAAPRALRDYALVADGRRGALIGPHGDVVWMCAPAWGSDAVLSALIGGPGAFTVAPTATHVWGGHYEPGTLVWRSRWVTREGICECREALAAPGEAGRAVLLRRIEAGERPARLRVVVSVRAGFGRHGMDDLALHDGVWTGRSGPIRLRLQGAGAGRVRRVDGADAVVLELGLGAGRAHDLVLELADRVLPADPPDPAALWRRTEAAWAAAIPALEDVHAPRDARQAYAVMRGLTGPEGGMVAAATLGLPERARQRRNYDYRYAWIRDTCIAGQAVAAAGPHALLAETTAFVAERLLADGPDLRPAYTATGGPVPDERALPLPGYPGAPPVAGNHAGRQFQLDGFGEALLLFAAAARRGVLDRDGRRAARVAAGAIAARWREPDAGIWELEERRWTHSRLACVAGLRAVARELPAPDAGWEGLAGAILAETGATSRHPSGRWQRSPDDPRVDAALLLPAVRGALPAGDRRTEATLAAVLDELCEDGYAFRYRPDDRPLGEAEGAFLLCGLAVALALLARGDRVGAMAWFERSRAACATSGLFSEEFDVAQRQPRGNLPQAFVHALLLECAARLGAAA